MSGSKGPAEQGTLVMMCAGDKAVFEAIEDTGLAAVGKAAFYLGEVGRASRMKLAVNMVMGQVRTNRFDTSISLSISLAQEPLTC